MHTILRPYDIGCEPSPSVSAEAVIQNADTSYVLFFAVSKAVDERGYLKDLGVAVVECQHCSATKFGYPNDEGRPEHRMNEYGLDAAGSSILEVVGSAWAHEVFDQMTASTQRIWGGRDASWKPSDGEPPRHFILLLKEKTFECLAGALVVRSFAKTYPEALQFVNSQLFTY